MQARMPGRIRRLGLVITAAALIATLVPVGAAGQEAGEPAPPAEPQAGLRLLGDERLPSADSDTELYVWPEGRRGYQFESAGANARTKTRLYAYDLDTLSDEPVAVADPSLDADTPYMNHWGGSGATGSVNAGHALAVDRVNGRVFVPHHDLDLESPAGDGDTDASQRVCTAKTGLSGDWSCFAGVYVLDGETLALEDRIRFRPIGTDGLGVKLVPMAISYAASRETGESGKLHVLLAELTLGETVLANDFVNNPNANAEFTQHWVVQIDVETGDTEWMQRISACRGTFVRTIGGPVGVVFRNDDPERPIVWAGCWARGVGNTTVVALDLDESDPENPSVSGVRQFLGPSDGAGFVADPASERIVVRSATRARTTLWVFDGRREAFVGRLGVGPQPRGSVKEAIDPATGRLYVFAAERIGDLPSQSHSGGLAFTDLRRDTLDSLTWHHELWPPFAGTGNRRVAVEPATADRPRRVFVKAGHEWRVIEDRIPVSSDPPPPVPDGRSDDVPERPGATAAGFTASGRGYGFRTLLVGGVGGVYQFNTIMEDVSEDSVQNILVTSEGGPCRRRLRDLMFGLAGAPEPGRRSLIDSAGSASAAARPIYVDPQTAQDLERPWTRCRPYADSGQDGQSNKVPTWDELPMGSLLRGDLAAEPGVSQVPGTGEAGCSIPTPVEGSTEAASGQLAAQVRCAPSGVQGDSQALQVGSGPVQVAGATSSYEVDRDEDGGVVATVDSAVRGVHIVGEQGAVRIDEIRASLEVWATGRRQPDDPADDSNCDRDRTAGTCYVRSFSGVSVIDASGQEVFGCDPCRDESNHQAMAEAMQAALGDSWLVRLREPARDLATGSTDGVQAAWVKTDAERFLDANLKGDLLPTVPALELLRLNDITNYPGRQLFQFAAVEADLSYTITCLLEVVDGQCVQAPASLEIALTDPSGQPLAGGLFEVVADEDGDGSLSVEETLGEARTCTTAPDGTCGFGVLPAGDYVVRQPVAPPGYVPMDDTAVSLPPGGQGQLDVVNGTLPVTGIVITLGDATGAALPGGEFEVLGGQAASAPIAACTTDALGVCRFDTAGIGVDELVPVDTGLVDVPEGLLQVPAGDYTIHQAAAPDGFEPIDDLAFTLPHGRIANVGVRNAAVATPAAAASPTPQPTEPAGAASPEVPPAVPEEAASNPVAIQEPPPVSQPVFRVQSPPADQAAEVAPARPSTVVQIFQTPAQAARIVLREPKQAAAFGLVMLVFAAAIAATWRRKMMLRLLGDT